MADFYQAPPQLRNSFDEDRLLREWLSRKLPSEVFKEIEPDLHRLGERAVTEIARLGNEAEANPPRHIPYDAWGRRIDCIAVCQAWKDLERIAAEEGIIATAYERKHGVWSRVHQFARLYLFAPPSAIAACPLAMTDGAARILETQGSDDLRREVLPRFTTREPARFQTCGQWMTERTGGSDVSGTTTIAQPLPDGRYALYGTKWFTSATTAPWAMTLARIESDPPSGKGLSLFLLPVHDAFGRPNQIFVHRLKEKLGTRALPTAELTLQGTPAHLIGAPGEGVRRIATLLNVTRAYNAVCAVGSIRQGLALARDYARRRRVFGKLLAEQPAHIETLAELQVEFEAAFHLTFRLAEAMGREEVTGSATDRAIARLLTPIVKLYTARQAVAAASETLEAFGGAGYVEDTGLPRLLRDAQVLSIWEGTTNVLSLDVLRAIGRDQAFEPLLEDLEQRLSDISLPALSELVCRVHAAVQTLREYVQRLTDLSSDAAQAGARQFAFSLARTYAAALLLEHAHWRAVRTQSPVAIASALRWCRRGLAEVAELDQSWRCDSRFLALEDTA